MPFKLPHRFSRYAIPAAALAAGFLGGQVIAQAEAPSKHQGLQVANLGAIDETNMSAQIGLTGYKMQLRAITIEPGGQIAKHSHATRPGLVQVISGTWTEGRPSGEEDYTDDSKVGIVEDRETVHWFYNRGEEPATALVCDIVPSD